MSAPVSEVDVLVVFTGQTGLRRLRFLKPGFRHCFACLRIQGRWVLYEPLSHRTDISFAGPWPARDLVAWMRGRDLTVAATRFRNPPRVAAFWRPYTCVEAVKRVIGLYAPRVFTPWQLFRHLEAEGAVHFPIGQDRVSMPRTERLLAESQKIPIQRQESDEPVVFTSPDDIGRRRRYHPGADIAKRTDRP